MKIVIANDHAGYKLKAFIKEKLESEGHEVEDLGADSEDSVDYPDFAHRLSEKIESTEGGFKMGILICGSGNGVCMSANRHKGVRAALAWMPEIAGLARLHNNANVLCLPARFVHREDASAIVDSFLNTEFEGGRHEKRVEKINC